MSHFDIPGRASDAGPDYKTFTSDDWCAWAKQENARFNHLAEYARQLVAEMEVA